MKKLIFTLLSLLLASVVSAQIKTQDAWSSVVAFVNVNVIPMDRERVLPNQTVVVRDGLIVEIGDAKKVRVPRGAYTIEGKGKFLLPGLSDSTFIFLRRRISAELGTTN